MIFRRKPKLAPPDAATNMVEPTRFSTPKQAGEHDELEALHTALSAQKRASALALHAERLETDAARGVDDARKAMRRIAEQR